MLSPAQRGSDFVGPMTIPRRLPALRYRECGCYVRLFPTIGSEAALVAVLRAAAAVSAATCRLVAAPLPAVVAPGSFPIDCFRSSSIILIFVN